MTAEDHFARLDHALALLRLQAYGRAQAKRSVQAALDAIAATQGGPQLGLKKLDLILERMREAGQQRSREFAMLASAVADLRRTSQS